MSSRFTMLFAAAVSACLMVSIATPIAQSQYARVAEIPIGGAGAFDYLNVDSAAKRLYVTQCRYCRSSSSRSLRKSPSR